MGDERYRHPPQFAGRYPGCVLDEEGICSRWNHDHAPAVALDHEHDGAYARLEARAVELVAERDMALRMHAVQSERANRLEVERDEHQWNALEMARKADLAERRAEEAEYHVEQLRDARDRAERQIERIERLADEWEGDYPTTAAACNREVDEWWITLRGALAKPAAGEADTEVAG